MTINVLASGSKGNCYLISDGSTSLLLECGIPIQKIKEGCNFNLSSVSGCLISHEHKDHCYAVNHLLKTGVDIYCTAGTAGACGISGIHVHKMDLLKDHNIGTLVVVAFSVKHDASEPCGFYIVSRTTKERLVFITDAEYTEYCFRHVTHMMVEANYSEEGMHYAISENLTPEQLKSRIRQSHMSIETTIKMIKANDLSRLKEVYLLHLSGNNADPEEFQKAVQDVVGKDVRVIIA